MLFRLVIFFLFTSCLAYSQSKRAFNLIEKEKYTQAWEVLKKALDKDTINVEANYAMSVYYFTYKNPYFDHDSAYYYIRAGIDDYPNTDFKDLEKLLKYGINNATLVNQKLLIENYAFVLTKAEDKQADYDIYLEKYPTSLKVDSAIWYRNLRAYQTTSSKHTWQEYELYMTRYAESEKYNEAKNHYDTLIYMEKTSDGKLASLSSFIEAFPLTPFRDQIEASIFRISTSDHTISSYKQFIETFPESKTVNKAVFRIALINSDFLDSSSLKFISKDSIFRLKELENQNLFLRYEGNQFVFQGATFQIRNNFQWIDELYKCEEINSKYLLVKQEELTHIINRNGTILFSYPDILGFSELGSGILSFATPDGSGAFIIGDGLLLAPTFDEIKVIQNQYIAAKKGLKWGLTSINGIELFPPMYEVIEDLEGLVKIGSTDKFDIVSIDFFIPFLDADTNKLKPVYSDLEVLDNEMILLYKGDQQAIYTTELRPLVLFQLHELTQLAEGVLAETDEGYYIHLRESIVNSNTLWDDANYSANWLMLKNTSGWNLYPARKDSLFESGIDSLKILNESALQTFKGDSSTIYLTSGKSFRKSIECEMNIIASPPSRNNKSKFYYEIVLEDKSIFITNQLDTVDLPEKGEKISAVGNEYLIYTLKDKKGLLDSLGNKLLPPVYDGIANYKDGSVTLLIDGNLGLYNLSKNILIPPEYHRSLSFYSDTLLFAFQDGKFGLISKTNGVVMPFEYSDLKYFNDSLVWVTKGETWNLINIYSGNLIMDNITNFSQPESYGADNFFFETPRGRGIVNSKTGLLINGAFTEIQKRGTQIDPLYITELFVNEAKLYIQVVYDKKGEIIFRNAYSEEEYEKVICEN